jgi:prophage antirepressor-like protein
MREEVAKVNSLQIFQHNGWTVRVIEINGEPWFVARDVCEILEHSNPSKAVKDLVDEDDLTTGYPIVDSMGRTQHATIVNESGLYSLILGSRKPEAKAFKRWVTHEVLPAIRKTGSYSVNQKPLSQAEALLQMAQYLVEQEKRMVHIEMELQVHKHRLDNLDHVDVIGDKQQRLNAMVRKIAQQNGWTFQRAWREFTTAFNTAYHTNLTQRIENYKQKHGLKELSRPQYLSMVDQLDDAIRIADKMLNQVPVGV